MLRLTCERFPDGEWVGLLSVGRVDAAREIFDERKKRNEEADHCDFSDCLQFCDKATIKQKGRDLFVAQYQKLRCDAYEPAKHNLIEAKSSNQREYVRMAVGQLLDYAHLGQKKLGKMNKAILLPRKPDGSVAGWLKTLGIRVIWREKKVLFR